jgi:hypothetical protein
MKKSFLSRKALSKFISVALLTGTTFQYSLANNLDYKISQDTEISKSSKVLDSPLPSPEDMTDFAFDALSDTDVMPFPSDYAAKLGKLFFSGFLPSPEDPFAKISQTLAEMNAKLDKIIVIDQATLDAVNSLIDQYTNNEFYQGLAGANSSLTGINNKFRLFSDPGFGLSMGSDDFYRYAAKLCSGGTCNRAEQELILNLLDGEPPISTSKPLSSARSGSSDTLYQLYTSFSDSLYTQGDSSINNWSILNEAYSDVLNSPKTNTSDRMLILIAANNALSLVQAGYYQSLTELYNMLALQLAVYYAHPDFYENVDASGKKRIILQYPITLSDKEGKAGYEESLVALNKFFKTDIQSQIVGVFGGNNYTIGNDGSLNKGEYQKGIIKYDSANEFLTRQFGIKKGSKDNNQLLSESAAKSCQITSADAPKKSGKNMGHLNLTCETKDANGNTQDVNVSLDMPYTVSDANEYSGFVFSDIDFKNLDGRYYVYPNSIDAELIKQFAQNGLDGPSMNSYDDTISRSINGTHQQITARAYGMMLDDRAHNTLNLLDIDDVRHDYNRDTPMYNTWRNPGWNGNFGLPIDFHGYDHHSDPYMPYDDPHDIEIQFYQYILTINGHLFDVKIDRDVNRTLLNYGCMIGDNGCQRVDGDRSKGNWGGVAWQQNATSSFYIDSYHYVGPDMERDARNMPMVDNLSRQFQFTESQDYRDYKNGKTWSYQAFALNNTLENDKVIMTSSNGQYHLQSAEGKLIIVDSDGHQTWSSGSIIQETLAAGDSPLESIVQVSFAQGNLSLDNGSNKTLWSVSKLYEKNGKVYTSDPYAKLTLTDRGELIITTSSSSPSLGINGVIWSSHWAADHTNLDDIQD